MKFHDFTFFGKLYFSNKDNSDLKFLKTIFEKEIQIYLNANVVLCEAVKLSLNLI